MVEVTVRSDDVELDAPTVIEGLPGVGLVGKIATDHLVNEFDMDHYADVTGDGLPPVAAFDGDGPEVSAPTRLFVDEDRDLLALKGEVPVSAIDAPTFAADLTRWFRDHDALPCYLTGFPVNREPDAVPDVYGVSTWDGDRYIDAADVAHPPESGLISGPAGALLSHSRQGGLDAVGFVVETDPRFPDPLGARVLLERAIAPLTGLDIDTDPLIEQAEQIIEAREQLAEQMQQAAQHESSQVEHTGMYQ